MRAAIVTGISRGLGEALAVAMLARGFAVLGVGRTASAKLKGKLYYYAACDLARPALIAASVTPALRTGTRARRRCTRATKPARGCA